MSEQTRENARVRAIVEQMQGDVAIQETIAWLQSQLVAKDRVIGVTNAFTQQLGIKNGRVVWSGDYDDISDQHLRQLVANFLTALYALQPPTQEASDGV